MEALNVCRFILSFFQENILAGKILPFTFLSFCFKVLLYEGKRNFKYFYRSDIKGEKEKT